MLVACGTAHYACHVAKYWFESLARLPVEIEVASEFRYREPPLGPGALGSRAGVDLVTLRVAVDRGEIDLGQLARTDRAASDALAERLGGHPQPAVRHPSSLPACGTRE